MKMHGEVIRTGDSVEKKQNTVLTFKNRASYIWEGHTATIQMLHSIYFFNKYKC
jgi:hypothetical protein